MSIHIYLPVNHPPTLTSLAPPPPLPHSPEGALLWEATFDIPTPTPPPSASPPPTPLLLPTPCPEGAPW